jgi:DNA-binding NtrC family response regulator
MEKVKSQESEVLDLSGARILVVEDDYYIADDLKRTLIEAGAEILGPFSSVEKAHEAIDAEQFDCAVLDLNLHGESGLPIADRLTEEGKSFAIATGFGSAAVPVRFKQVPRIETPFDPSALLRLVGQLRCAR